MGHDVVQLPGNPGALSSRGDTGSLIPFRRQQMGAFGERTELLGLVILPVAPPLAEDERGDDRDSTETDRHRQHKGFRPQ